MIPSWGKYVRNKQDAGSKVIITGSNFNRNRDHPDRVINGLLEAMEATNLKEGIIVTYDQKDHFEKDKKNFTVIPGWK